MSVSKTYPSDDAASIIQERIDADMDPAVDTIEALQAMVKFQRLSECATTQPLVHHHLSLVRVNEEVETVEAPEFLNGGVL